MHCLSDTWKRFGGACPIGTLVPQNAVDSGLAAEFGTPLFASVFPRIFRIRGQLIIEITVLLYVGAGSTFARAGSFSVKQSEGVMRRVPAGMTESVERRELRSDADLWAKISAELARPV
jgi:hypothetical protein